MANKLVSWLILWQIHLILYSLQSCKNLETEWCNFLSRWVGICMLSLIQVTITTDEKEKKLNYFNLNWVSLLQWSILSWFLEYKFWVYWEGYRWLSSLLSFIYSFFETKQFWKKWYEGVVSKICNIVHYLCNAANNISLSSDNELMGGYLW